VLEEIEDLTNPKVKTGKKSLTPEQQQTKSQMLALLDAVRDESGKDAAVRLVFEPKTSKIDRDEFVNILACTNQHGNKRADQLGLHWDGSSATPERLAPGAA
jgi:topoisomerase IV subunit A